MLHNDKLKRNVELVTRQIKSLKQVHSKEIKKVQEELENLYIEYRSKDKEWRLLSLKLSELQRISRFNQLPPLELDPINESAATNRSKSTLKKPSFLTSVRNNSNNRTRKNSNLNI